MLSESTSSNTYSPAGTVQACQRVPQSASDRGSARIIGATVAQIEAAAGLSPGVGGLYHHFGSKEEVLAVSIERHLARLDALRDVLRLLAGVGDMRAELTITARYFLAELDSQSEPFRAYPG